MTATGRAGAQSILPALREFPESFPLPDGLHPRRFEGTV